MIGDTIAIITNTEKIKQVINVVPENSNYKAGSTNFAFPSTS